MKIYSFPEDSTEALPIKVNFYSHDEGEHMHDYIELVYIMSGSGIHYIDGAAYPLHRGCLLYVDYGQVHSYTEIDNISYVNFTVRPEYFSESLAGTRSIDAIFSLLNLNDIPTNSNRQMALFEGGIRARAERLIFEMLEENLYKTPGYQNVIRNNIINLLIYMRRNIVSEESLLPIADIPDKLKKAISYIDEHCGEKITLFQVSELCNYSEVYLSKLIRQCFGFGFSEYLMRKRINKSMKYLVATNCSIQEISILAGFTNKTHFYKTFKKYIGVQPSFIRIYQQNFDNINRSRIKNTENELFDSEYMFEDE